ncbi:MULTISPECIES: holin family protein [unclassified Roseobacter]|uniref:holin family protein n=1 Tax=unclassified Roseobacter TaxID=196798 RepID=UPI001490C111|nr:MULTISPECIES: holin family protein [unclassified Roseobacter]
MGMIGRILTGLFGGGRNVVAETAEVFRVNAEASAQRQSDYAQAALAQFGTEFQIERKGCFDRFIDGLNRLPRPLMVVATFALFASAMFDPIWFAERMQGLALVPEPLWWLAGTIVAFYFGGRFQIKAHEFQQTVAQATAMVPQVMENISRLRALRHDSPGVADTGTDTELTVASIEPSDNPAVQAWREASA